MADKIKWPIIHTIPSTIGSTSWPVIEAPVPSTLWVRPGAGNTITAAYSTDSGVNFTDITNLTGITDYSEVRVYSGFSDLKITTTTDDGGSWGII